MSSGNHQCYLVSQNSRLSEVVCKSLCIQTLNKYSFCMVQSLSFHYWQCYGLNLVLQSCFKNTDYLQSLTLLRIVEYLGGVTKMVEVRLRADALKWNCEFLVLSLPFSCTLIPSHNSVTRPQLSHTHAKSNMTT